MACATLLSLWVAVLSLLRGSTRFDGYGLNAWQIMATYYVVGVSGGCLAGALRPLASSRWRAAIVGAVIGVLGYTAIGVVMEPKASWSVLQSGLVLGVPIGGIVGYRTKSG